MLFAVVVNVALPIRPASVSSARTFSRLAVVALFDLLPHDESNQQALRGLAPMRVFAFDLDQRFAERRRVVIEIPATSDRASRAD